VSGPDADAPAGDAAAGGGSDGPPGQGGQAGHDGPATGGVAADGPAAVDQGAPVDAGAADQPSGGVDVAPGDGPAGCGTQTIVLGRGGTTSSCSFKVPVSIPHDRVNLLLGGGRLCRQGSNNCTPRGGWFWFGDEVALCDATCLSWEASRANLVLEAGCASESCFVACGKEGGPCGDGINGCCVGWRCSNRVCATCARGGQACLGTSECCSGTCQNGTCVGDLGSACATQAGCSRGECREGVCQCAVDQILCNSGCVSYLDPNNCRGCGNVCATGTGRVCTADGCVCDPKSAFPDECNGTCVNKSNDRTNCGFCFFTCGRLDQVCVASKCGCPAGLTDCNGSCYDLSTSQNHCGMCNRGCPAPVEVCTAGDCACAPGLTRCPIAGCVDLMTNRFNCRTCGNACNGNKPCNNGTCG
jgi:hypothetical protein